MTRGKISLGRAWFSRVFPGWAGPEEVDDVAIAQIPLGGSGRYEDLQYKTFQSLANNTVQSDAVPDGFNWWIPFCAVFHTDPALATRAWVAIRNRVPNDVAITSTFSVADNNHFGILRPVILPSGWRMVGRLADVTAGGTAVVINFFYVEIPIGEYVAPL